MTERGQGARRTPYELVFVEGGHEGEAFPAMAEEAKSRDVDTSVPERLLLALAAGVRPGRPGFNVIAVEAPVPDAPAAHWGDAAGREEGNDFENILPGGELGGLFALTSVAEALRLASLVFHYAASEAGSPGTPLEAVGAQDASAHAPPASSLPYRPIPGGADG